ncbi:MAG: hypothetical protein MJ211_14475 [Bacteroidales bacterium]|nr:hypothetical protein [Bacteroidales bacterium]
MNDIIIELCYLLKSNLDRLPLKNLTDYCNFFNDNQIHKLILYGIFTNKDLIEINDQTVAIISNDKKLCSSVIEFLATLNQKQLYSIAENHVVLAPGKFKEIIDGNENDFLSRKINFDLYPCNRLMISLERVGIKTYMDLKNFTKSSFLPNIPGVGGDTYKKLVTIVISDYRFLKENNMLGNNNFAEINPLNKFSEILSDSYDYLSQNIAFKFKPKWKYTFEKLDKSLEASLKTTFGENIASFLINLPIDPEDIYFKKYCKKHHISDQNMYVFRDELINEFCNQYVDLENINNKKSYVFDFYLNCYSLGKIDMGVVVGLLYKHNFVYRKILDKIGETYSSIGETLTKLNVLINEQIGVDSYE